MTSLACSCGWSGADWADAKVHIVAAMKQNQINPERSASHEVTASSSPSGSGHGDT